MAFVAGQRQPHLARKVRRCAIGCRRAALAGDWPPRLSNTSLVRVVVVPAEALLIALDLVGYAVSHGAACSAGAVEPSASLLAMGFSTEEAKQCIRISLHAHAAPAALAAGLSGLVEAIASFVQRARSAAF